MHSSMGVCLAVYLDASLSAYPVECFFVVDLYLDAWFCAGLFVAGALIPRLNVGLDQAVALPNDSYLQQYYK